MLFKTLVTISVVAAVSLVLSYAFINAQQEHSFFNNVADIKQNHHAAHAFHMQQDLNDQLFISHQLLAAANAANLQSEEQVAAFFNELWTGLQTDLTLSAMSISTGSTSKVFGRMPPKNSTSTLTTVKGQEITSVLCALRCELVTISSGLINGTQYDLLLVANINKTILTLKHILKSDIGVLSPINSVMPEQLNLKRYMFEHLTLIEKSSALLNYPLSIAQVSALEADGLHLTLNTQHFYIWFDVYKSGNKELKLLFIRDISDLVAQQSVQKNQVIVMFSVVMIGILVTMTALSIIPISQIKRLGQAIKLIGSKEYNTARFKLGEPAKHHLADELVDLELEFKNAIDVLEQYEHEIEHSQKKLIRQATIDNITGLFTRNVLIDDIAKHFEDKNTTIAIFFLDLDGFKPVNDNLGHEAGDKLLKKIGYRLKGVSNKFIKVYRIGGDEFVITYARFSGESALLKMAKAIVEIFSAPFSVNDSNIAITSSIGIAIRDETELAPDQLLRHADMAMYQAKEEGKNRFRFFDESMRAKTQMRFTIKNDFLTSLNKNQLFIVYQPIVCAKTGRIGKLEALCRWNHPTLNFINPPVFIDVLEETENMNILFNWIVSQVVDELKALEQLGFNDIVMSVNVSSSQLVDDTALEIIKNSLDRHNISANRIELEITETTLITNFKRASEWVNHANLLGFRVAIDDFGAGYSSLSYLSAFKYDTVKLDRSLLNRIDTDSKQQRIISSLTQMIHGLSVPIVAEGAESQLQFETLKKLGCDYIQGFFIAKPLLHDELSELLSNYRRPKVVELIQ